MTHMSGMATARAQQYTPVFSTRENAKLGVVNDSTEEDRRQHALVSEDPSITFMFQIVQETCIVREAKARRFGLDGST